MVELTMTNENKGIVSYEDLLEEIKLLRKRVKDLERERDILLALHRRDME